MPNLSEWRYHIRGCQEGRMANAEKYFMTLTDDPAACALTTEIRECLRPKQRRMSFLRVQRSK